MQETIGTLSLKIARLQQQLHLIQQQQALSSHYPQHQLALSSAWTQTHNQLCQLIQAREEMSNNVVDYPPHNIFNGEKNGQKPFFTAH